jgi:hypothetical protein
VQLLSNDEFLRPLYQEAIKSESIGAERFARNFRRLLKTYSQDLKEEASEKLEFDAAKLAHISSRHVVDSIKQRYSWEVPESSEVDEVVEDSSDEEATSAVEALSTLAPVKNFLTKTSPYAKLQRDFQSFVKQSVKANAETDGRLEWRQAQNLPDELLLADPRTEQGWASVMRQWLARVGILEKPLEPGKVRIRWKCCCGIELFDDYLDTGTGDFEEIKRFLNHPTDIQEASSHTGQGPDPPTTGNRLFSRLITPIIGFFSRQYRNPPSQPSLPTHNSPSLQSSSGGVSRIDPMYLLLCMSTGRLGVQLDQRCINSLNSDRELFAFLQNVYFQRRGKLRSWFSLKTPIGIKFVEVSLCEFFK